MEIARMNYYFTGILIVLFVLLCFIRPAHPRNEYLNTRYPNTVALVKLDVSVSNKEIQIITTNPDNSYNSDTED